MKFELEGEEVRRANVNQNGTIYGFTKWKGRRVAVVLLPEKEVS